MTEENPGPEPSADAEPSIEPITGPLPPRWAAPPRGPAEVPGAPGLVFADTPSRLVAYFVDAFIVSLIGSVAAFALGFGERVKTATSTSLWLSGTTFAVAFAVVSLLYFLVFWTGGRRATIGQRLFDIQVGTAFEGRPLSLDQALGRWVGYGSFLGFLTIAPGLGAIVWLVWLAWVLVLLGSTARSKSKQGLHDRFASTALVRPAGRTSSGPALACLIVLVLLGVLFVLGIVALIYLGSHFPLVRPPGTTI